MTNTTKAINDLYYTILYNLNSTYRRTIRTIVLTKIDINKQLCELLYLLQRHLCRHNRNIRSDVRLNVGAITYKLFYQYEQSAILYKNDFNREKLYIFYKFDFQHEYKYNFQHNDRGDNKILFKFIRYDSFLHQYNNAILGNGRVPYTPSKRSHGVISSSVDLTMSHTVQHMTTPMTTKRLPHRTIFRVESRTKVLRIGIDSGVVTLPIGVLYITLNMGNIVFQRRTFEEVVLNCVLALRANGYYQIRRVFETTLRLRGTIEVTIGTRFPNGMFLLASTHGKRIVTSRRTLQNLNRIFTSFATMVNGRKTSPPGGKCGGAQYYLRHIHFEFNNRNGHSPDPSVFRPQPTYTTKE